ncbi:uncharacterized protein DUF559 [Naumannella halotolerans]|uniref:Uncharacterized protein DUF559 n=2 Tax=Naumannella halotolerans TaxID=993414 RepID=A0A4R7J1E2_9ACTN|nr:uncharacterized protein DUF559 [Naumannella halotolerans]
MLPGIWAQPDPPLLVRLQALMAFDRDAVVTGHAAACLHFAARPPSGVVDVSCRRRRDRHAGYTFERRWIDPEFITVDNGMRCTGPAMTAIDLAATDDGSTIDTALRQRAVSLEELHRALAATTGRRGHQLRRRVLADSRDQPWSAAERLAHRLLRQASITGWRANHRISVGARHYFGDIVFAARRLVVEIDGWQSHGSAAAFQQDRTRQNALVLAGWRVLRFTWMDLSGAGFVTAVRAALRSR